MEEWNHYQDVFELKDQDVIDWFIPENKNVKVTLEGNRTLNVDGLVYGDEGNIVICQDSVGNRTLDIPANSYVGGVPATSLILNSNPNDLTYYSFYYDGVSIFFNSSLDSNRVTNLENNEFKITYYEIVSGASGSLSVPTEATINEGEFGLSGNAILSKVDVSNKPTFESPKTAGGTIVTASLNTSTGAWTSSGTYTDTSVALIYSIKIKAKFYSNLDYDRIIESEESVYPIASQAVVDGGIVKDQVITPETLANTTQVVHRTGDESISGVKTFNSDLIVGSNLILSQNSSGISGSNADLNNHNSTNIRLTNGGLVSLASISITGVITGHQIWLHNDTGNTIAIVNNYGSSPSGSKSILTTTNSNINILDQGSIVLEYDSTDSAWRLVGNFSNTLTLGGVTYITGGGTISLGGFTATIPATGTVYVSRTRNYSLVSLSVSTARTPNSTRDTFVVITFSLASGSGQVSQGNVQVDNSGGGTFTTIAIARQSASVLLGLNLTQQQSITFTCPQSSQYRWTTSDSGGGATTVISIYELTL